MAESCTILKRKKTLSERWRKSKPWYLGFFSDFLLLFTTFVLKPDPDYSWTREDNKSLIYKSLAYVCQRILQIYRWMKIFYEKLCMIKIKLFLLQKIILDFVLIWSSLSPVISTSCSFISASGRGFALRKRSYKCLHFATRHLFYDYKINLKQVFRMFSCFSVRTVLTLPALLLLSRSETCLRSLISVLPVEKWIC